MATSDCSDTRTQRLAFRGTVWAFGLCEAQNSSSVRLLTFSYFLSFEILSVYRTTSQRFGKIRPSTITTTNSYARLVAFGASQILLPWALLAQIWSKGSAGYARVENYAAV